MEINPLRGSLSSIDRIFTGNIPCVLGMLAGFLWDMSRNPIGMIARICSGGGIYSLLTLHFVMMPGTHLGMGLGMALCIGWHLRGTAPGRPGLILLLLQTGGALAAMTGAMSILAGSADPIFVIVGMGAAMLMHGAMIGSMRKKGGGLSSMHDFSDCFSPRPLQTRFRSGPRGIEPHLSPRGFPPGEGQSRTGAVHARDF